MRLELRDDLVTQQSLRGQMESSSGDLCPTPLRYLLFRLRALASSAGLARGGQTLRRSRWAREEPNSLAMEGLASLGGFARTDRGSDEAAEPTASSASKREAIVPAARSRAESMWPR